MDYFLRIEFNITSSINNPHAAAFVSRCYETREGEAFKRRGRVVVSARLIRIFCNAFTIIGQRSLKIEGIDLSFIYIPGDRLYPYVLT